MTQTVELVGDAYDGDDLQWRGTVHVAVSGDVLCGNPTVQRYTDSGRYRTQATTYPLGDGRYATCQSCSRAYLSRHGSNDETFTLLPEVERGDYLRVQFADGETVIGRVQYGNDDANNPSASRFINLILSDEPIERWAYGTASTLRLRKFEGDPAHVSNNSDGPSEFEDDRKVASIQRADPPADCPDRRTDAILNQLADAVAEFDLGEYGGVKANAKDRDVFHVSFLGDDDVDAVEQAVAAVPGAAVESVSLASEREHSSYSSVKVRFDNDVGVVEQAEVVG